MGKGRKCTVNQILDRYERECLDSVAPRTKQDYLRHLPVLREWFGKKKARKLKPKHFRKFMAVETGKQQRNKQLAILSSALSNAVKRWYILKRNVVMDVMRHPSKPRDRLVLADEFTGVHALTYEPIKLVMELALATGQRQGDVLAFKWSDIKDGALHLQQTKTGKRLAITVTPDLQKILDRCQSLRAQFDSPDDNIVINTRGRAYTSDGFRSCWQRNMRAYVAAGGTRYTFHDLRAMCATSFGTVEEAGRLLGHANPSMTRKVYRRGVERVAPLDISHASGVQSAGGVHQGQPQASA
jgi:integrase